MRASLRPGRVTRQPGRAPGSQVLVGSDGSDRDAAAGELSFYITGLMSIQVDERPAGPDRVRAARPGR